MESGEMGFLSKQAILSLPKDVVKTLDGKILDEYINVKDIEALPTVQSQSTAGQLNDSAQSTNLIDRQEAIDVLHGYFDGMLDTDTVCPADIYGLFECIPSAQPETAKRIVGKSRDGMTLWYQCDMCNEPVDEQDNYCRGCGRRLMDDLISRQEARLCLTGDITNMTIEQYIKMVGERLDALTPSKPKVKEADWIPCSVRLPEGDEAVLANLTKEYVTWTRALLIPGSIVQYEYAKGVVDAWRPLPEAYKEGGEKI